MTAPRHVPPLGLAALTPLYDLAVAMTMQEGRLRSRLLEQLELAPGVSVLDVGCGTGTLAILMFQVEPGALIVGVDADADALRIAGRKASRAGARLRFDLGSAEHLRYPDASFDRVVFSLMLHHLERPIKLKALAEARRVLRPGGTLHIADLGPARSRLERIAALPIRLLDGESRVADNLDGRIPQMVEAAGFRLLPEQSPHQTLFGPVSFIRAERTGA